VPQRFHVDVGGSKEGRASVMDRWELERRKRERGQPGRPIQARGQIQGVQVREPRKSSRTGALKRAN
jgi:hypothetical protein